MILQTLNFHFYKFSQHLYRSYYAWKYNSVVLTLHKNSKLISNYATYDFVIKFFIYWNELAIYNYERCTIKMATEQKSKITEK